MGNVALVALVAMVLCVLGFQENDHWGSYSPRFMLAWKGNIVRELGVG